MLFKCHHLRLEIKNNLQTKSMMETDCVSHGSNNDRFKKACTAISAQASGGETRCQIRNGKKIKPG